MDKIEQEFSARLQSWITLLKPQDEMYIDVWK
jgi:hypothetical protein